MTFKVKAVMKTLLLLLLVAATVSAEDDVGSNDNVAAASSSTAFSSMSTGKLGELTQVMLLPASMQDDNGDEAAALDKKKSNSDKPRYLQYQINAHIHQDIDPDELDDNELLYLADTLISSYNQVHGGGDVEAVYAKVEAKGKDDDSDGPISTALRGSKKRQPRWIGFNSWFHLSFGSQCRLCPNDDDMLEATPEEAAAFEEHVAIMMVQGSSVRAAWERTWCQQLALGPFKGWWSATNCVIDIDRYYVGSDVATAPSSLIDREAAAATIVTQRM